MKQKEITLDAPNEELSNPYKAAAFLRDLFPLLPPLDSMAMHPAAFSAPIFVDSQACLCGIQANKEAVAWQCVGNHTQINTPEFGKWFAATKDDKDTISHGFAADTNPPDLKKPLVFNKQSKSLEPLDKQNLDIRDSVCTGVNRTLFSTSFYQSLDDLANKKTPIDALPCILGNATPLQIQNASSWIKDGCLEGFLCKNNTVNSLPQYCPAVLACHQARLGGKICTFKGENVPMGRFEPVICQEGRYCPKEKLGQESLVCPEGSYCQPGCATPTPCTIGSRCPEGSSFEVFLIPTAAVVMIDVLLIIGIVILYFRSRKIAKNSKGGVGFGALKASMQKYKPIDDDAADHELANLNATYMPGPGADSFGGFEGIFEMYAPAENEMVKPGQEAELSPQLRLFIDSMRKATDATSFGLSFGYNGLRFQPKKNGPAILQNVTGSIERGSLVAVMGGSGAGKSTFVNVLMGKTAHTGGKVTVNGMSVKIDRYKKLIGYVPQDDIVFPELTVRENILHSARIRLPRTWKDDEIQAHVDCVVDCLELSHVRNSLVGSVSKPVISGGQRKRVSIGMELAAAPMAIFLDEPTSGLDSTSAGSIMRTLKALARLGISVITIIHQPRMEIYEILDNLILLGNGQIIYEGPREAANKYFEAMGFHFPPHSNHADVITDIITGEGRLYKKSGDISKDALIANWASKAHLAPAEVSDPRASAVEQQSMKSFLRKRGAPRLKQLWLCLARSFLQQYRTKGSFCAEMALASIAGFLLGIAQNSKKGILFVGLYNQPYAQLSTATDFKAAPELALLTAIAIGLISGAPGVRAFSEELLMYRREAEAGHSRIAYYMAKVISVFPRMILGCLHFTSILLLLANPIINWGFAFLANFLYFYCIYGLASVISMIVRREDAPLLATMISLIVGILSGAAPPLSKVKEWNVEFLWRASPGVWLAELYFGHLVGPYRYLYDVDLAAKVTGFRLAWGATSLGLLAAIGTIYRVIAFVALVFGHRLRR